MNQDEKKILNGVYCASPVVDDCILYKAAELNWLFENELEQANGWRDQDGRLKTTESAGGEDWLDNYSKLNYKIKKALSYLKGKQYIDYKQENDSFRICITYSGCEVARKLQTRLGQVDLWYRDNKDGIIWLLITIITSAIVTVITAIIIEKVS